MDHSESPQRLLGVGGSDDFVSMQGICGDIMGSLVDPTNKHWINYAIPIPVWLLVVIRPGAVVHFHTDIAVCRYLHRYCPAKVETARVKLLRTHLNSVAQYSYASVFIAGESCCASHKHGDSAVTEYRCMAPWVEAVDCSITESIVLL